MFCIPRTPARLMQCGSTRSYEQSLEIVAPWHDTEVGVEIDPVDPSHYNQVVDEALPEPRPADQEPAEEDQSSEEDDAAILASVQDRLSHLSATPPMVEFIFDTGEPSADPPIIVPPPPHANQPVLKLNTSVPASTDQFHSPSYESPSQRRRRERRTSGLIQAVPPSNVATPGTAVVGSSVLPTPRGRRSRRLPSPNRRRDGEIDVLDESDDDRENVADFRGRQKKRPSELRCFPVNSLGPKRGYPGLTPISPIGSGSFDFRRMPASPPLHKKVASLGSENIPRVGRVVEFASTPISPVLEDWP